MSWVVNEYSNNRIIFGKILIDLKNSNSNNGEKIDTIFYISILNDRFILVLRGIRFIIQDSINDRKVRSRKSYSIFCKEDRSRKKYSICHEEDRWAKGIRVGIKKID